MFYTIYKVTNTLNGKYYIGKHQTTHLNDGYMGSGKLLKRAIKKNGIENFSKEILFVFDNEQEMNAKEKELVVISEETYNLCPGGHGGFGYINQTIDHTERNRKISSNRNYKDSKFIENLSKSLKGKSKPWKQGISFGNWQGKKHKPESIEKMKKSAKNRIPWNKGKPWKDWHPNAK